MDQGDHSSLMKEQTASLRSPFSAEPFAIEIMTLIINHNERRKILNFNLPYCLYKSRKETEKEKNMMGSFGRAITSPRSVSLLYKNKNVHVYRLLRMHIHAGIYMYTCKQIYILIGIVAHTMQAHTCGHIYIYIYIHTYW